MHYNRANSYLFVNGTEIIKFKAKDSEIVACPLCLGNISKDFSVDNMKKTGLNGYVFVVTMSFFSCNALNAIPLRCVSMNNQECTIRPEIINTNSNEPTHFILIVLK